MKTKAIRKNFQSRQELQEFFSSEPTLVREILEYEDSLLQPGPFSVPGHCSICDQDVEFGVDYDYSWEDRKGMPIPNWRERLVCSECSLNSRLRASAEIILRESSATDRIYMTESVTALYGIIAALRPEITGSEFLRDGTRPGETNIHDVRCEDATCLTFSAEEFNMIASFEVLEHIPSYLRVLQEFFRCLTPGGMLVMTAPFRLNEESTLVRASIKASGEIFHHQDPEFHGDPVNGDGALCFYHFGWDLLDALRGVGFVEVALEGYWSIPMGYLGGLQFVIMAKKPT